MLFDKSSTYLFLYSCPFAGNVFRSRADNSCNASETDSFSSSARDRHDRQSSHEVASEVLYRLSEFLAKGIGVDRCKEQCPHQSYRYQVDQQPGKPIHGASSIEIGHGEFRTEDGIFLFVRIAGKSVNLRFQSGIYSSIRSGRSGLGRERADERRDEDDGDAQRKDGHCRSKDDRDDISQTKMLFDAVFEAFRQEVAEIFRQDDKWRCGDDDPQKADSDDQDDC